ncbi:phage tail tape measure protein [Curtobacterium sp. C2H10]|uniref:phage tail tape measure protein n=1 Tax=Curtobacterium sp. C2H10 TaxID=2736664 RepID=UPI0021C05B0F|nr:phage tail tape measure protein [Curtobacterium sp. C2H10]MCT9620738.1 phage tail tape measure protein [Curtobacterium sp. C2H10]
MAERVVKVTIQAAVANYLSGMEKVRKATADTAKESDKLEKVGQAAERVGGGLLTIGAAATGAVLVVTKMAADFDAQLSKVQAATNATASEMDKFRNQALTAGAAFGYTATQVTEAQVELGKAGLATADILNGGLNGVLALAASDNVDLGKATQIAAVAMKQFNLEGKDVPHIADELAAGAGKALGGVEQLGDALNQSGLVASNFGFSLEETTGVLSAFADAGLLGSDSGTSLKTMLQQLANPSKESAQLMKSLGINVEDANGKFLGAADIAQVLHDKLSTLSDAQRQQALAQIFGSDAVRAATVLYKEGADGIQGYIDQNNDAGYAMEQARLKSDNLNGDLKKLRSAFQTGLIETGTSASSALRPLVQTLTGVVQAVNGLPEPLKATALGATGVVGAVSLLGGGMLFAIPKIVEFRSALATLRDGGITARSALVGVTKFMTGPWGIALGVAATAAAVFAAQQMEAQERTAQLKATLDETTGAVTEMTRAQIAANLNAPGKFAMFDVGPSALQQAKNAGLSLETVTKAAEGNAKAYRELKAAQKELDDARGVGNLDANNAAKAADAVVRKVDEQRTALKGAKDQQKLLNEAQGDSETTSDAAANGLDSITQAADDATQAISDTANAIKGFNSAQLDVNSTQRDLEAAIDGVTDSIEQNGQSLDVTTEKGRANSAALDSIAQSTLNYAGALYQQTGDQDKATSALESGRKSLIAALGQYGVTGQAAEDYADKILGTPTQWSTLFTNSADAAGALVSEYQRKLNALPAEKRTNVNAATTAAQVAIQSVLDTLNAIPTQKTITVTTNRVTTGTADNTVGIFKAAGGYISGPGTGTSDSVPAMLSNGEYVIRERSVKKYGTGFLDRVNRGHYASGGLVQRYATGGRVQFNYNRASGQYDGLGAVSELMSMFGDTSLPVKFRNQIGAAALRYQTSMTKLADKSDTAASKLSDLRQSAASLQSSVASAIGRTDVGNYRTTSTLRRGLAKAAGNVTEFAGLLSTLAKKGINGNLLAEIASLGTAEGLPLARSLAAASAADIKSINSSYGTIQSTATKAGQTVADANYKALITSADKNARSLEKQIKDQSKAIQGIIARGFGLKGYAAGGYTGNGHPGQVAGVVHGREFVMNQYATARNLPYLEALNNGGTVRYMDPTPYRAATAQASAPVRSGDRHYHLTTLDPEPFVQAVERRERSEYA